MKCSDVNATLDRHGLSALSAAERANLDTHLGECRACAGAVAVYEMLLAEAPADPRAGLFAAISRGFPGRAPMGTPTVIPMTTPLRGPARRGLPSASVSGLVAVAALLLLAVFATVMQRPASMDDTLDDGRTARLPGDTLRLPLANPQRYVSLPVVSELSGLGDRISVWLFFMWSCLHCYELEADLGEWLADADADSFDLIRVPVQWNSSAVLHAQAFYAAEMLGVADSVAAEFYAAIHTRQQALDTPADIAEVFARAGVDRDDFLAAFDSREVAAALASGRALAEAFGVDATPTIVVDGAYRTNPSMTGTSAEMLTTVASLIESRQSLRAGAASPAIGNEACESGQASSIDVRILEAERQLSELLLRYTDRHPRVAGARAMLADLRLRRLALSDGSTAGCTDLFR